MEMVMQSGIKSLREELDRVKEENISIKEHIALLTDENMSHRNAVYAMSDEYATLKCELVSLRNSTDTQHNSLELNHNSFARDKYKPLVDRVENIELINTHLETELVGKISPESLLPLTTKCKDLEYSTQFQENMTFNLSTIFLKRIKSVSDVWEEIRSDPVRLLRINHEPIYKDDGSQVVRLTGQYSISSHCSATINLCVVLMNYTQDTIENTYRFSVVVKPELTRSVSDLKIKTHARKPQRYETTYRLADIPIEDIQKEGVCYLDCVNIQICYDRVIADSI